MMVSNWDACCLRASAMMLASWSDEAVEVTSGIWVSGLFFMVMIKWGRE